MGNLLCESRLLLTLTIPHRGTAFPPAFCSDKVNGGKSWLRPSISCPLPYYDCYPAKRTVNPTTKAFMFLASHGFWFLWPSSSSNFTHVRLLSNNRIVTNATRVPYSSPSLLPLWLPCRTPCVQDRPSVSTHPSIEESAKSHPPHAFRDPSLLLPHMCSHHSQRNAFGWKTIGNQSPALMVLVVSAPKYCLVTGNVNERFSAGKLSKERVLARFEEL